MDIPFTYLIHHLNLVLNMIVQTNLHRVSIEYQYKRSAIQQQRSTHNDSCHEPFFMEQLISLAVALVKVR